MRKLFIFLIILISAAGSFLTWLFNREKDGVPILIYHQVNDIDKDSKTLTVEQFDAQMKYLAEGGYNVITPDELLDAWEGNGTLPENPVVITFDDAHIDIYKNVFPILQKYKLRATFFLITDYVNLYPNYITWDQAREMQASGFVDIESHTLNHKLMTEIYSRDKLWDQLYGSKQAIEWYLKKPVNYIAYPDGKYTVEAEAVSKEAGYRAGFTFDYGLAHKEPQHYILDRIPIMGANSHTLFRFKMRLNGAPLIAPLYRFKNKLIKDGNPEVADLIWIP
ncbi:MAG: polysaccharide deacetylase family protein [Selenomonadaceae bacterium]|nr:polysaccharide deacetylase family protein [Selenomonadaceae bacterium]